MGTKNNFKKGSVEMLILHVLQTKGDCYGYELTQLIKQISDGYLAFPEGSMYPALYKLIDNQYISDYAKERGRRAVRVFYHIEEKGRRRLEELKKEYFETNRSIQKVLNYDFSNMEKNNEQRS